MVFAVELPFLNELVVLFMVSVGIAYLCYRLKLVPIVGFLIAGAVIGPNAFALVPEQELVDILAEIGVILLLFTIGIEFSLEKLNRIRKAIVVSGSFQVIVTTAIVTAILVLSGVSLNNGIYTGFLVALSSTAIVLGLFSQRGETDTPTGQLSLAVLIFQDLAIVLMVLLVPILAGDSDSGYEVLWILGKAVLLIMVVLILARRIIPWVLEKVAKTRKQELFLLSVVAICFGTVALSNMANVSLALGAFMAGLIVSESEFSEQALSEILPLRTIFNAVFFVSVGMLLDLRYVLEYPLLLVGIALGVILLKLIITSTGLLVLGYPVRIAAASGLALAQIGEFSFVLERAGRTAGMTPAGVGEIGSQTFIAVSVLLMILTPFLLNAGPKLGTMLARTPLKRFGQESGDLESDQRKTLEDHVIIVGYGPAGRHLVQVLQETGIPYVVVEMNPESVEEMKRNDIPAIYGDAGREHILELSGIAKAKLCVIATNAPSASPRIIKIARHNNPTLQIIVRTRYLTDVVRLENLGADIVIPEETETTVRIFSQVLGAYMIPREEIEQHVKTLRAHDYEIFRGSMQEAHLMVLQGLDEEGLHTRAVVVREGAPVAGKTLQELQLRKNHNLTVLAVRRGDKTVGNPAGDFEVQPGDRLIVVGLADRFAECADLFRATAEF
ncbi:Kef-type potassium/proton antiporter, CPA2 family [Fodinibius roseus]|uniref:Kef-type potassium/proton antiporter, CPA2 family n=1 Tax=Fodinibius roseus TaxID=1194090 RepID=A0A1M4ZU90_9BACT|nr:monovalent cation:proton antiporter family protein [Fodinibius roseus]SHF21186.1 Kef-type potassium/proton antiporter, CPA2 family [Fodinibius roseus]